MKIAVDLIMFDLDGTLADTGADLADAIIRGLGGENQFDAILGGEIALNFEPGTLNRLGFIFDTAL